MSNHIKGKVAVGNKFVISVLKKLGVYKAFVQTVKKAHKNPSIRKHHIFCCEGASSVDHAFTWAKYPHPGINWAEIDRTVEKECILHYEEYEQGWIYKNS